MSTWDAAMPTFALTGQRRIVCQYGENPHQKNAAYFAAGREHPLGMHNFAQRVGNPRSRNNIDDFSKAVEIVSLAGAAFKANSFQVPMIAVAVKHGSACGAGYGDVGSMIIEDVVEGDLEAIFGAVVCANFHLSAEYARVLRNHAYISKPTQPKERSLDVVGAASIGDEAVQILGRTTGKCRVLENQALERAAFTDLFEFKMKQVIGGFLIEDPSQYIPHLDDGRLVWSDQRKWPQHIWQGLLFGWAINALSRSNAVTVVRDKRLVGNGVGQTKRVRSSKIAVEDAGRRAEGAVGISESFFPVDDGVIALAKAGVKYLYATYNTEKNRDMLIEACRTHGMEYCLIPDADGRTFAHM